jgi:hypothetical protein
MNPRAKTSTSGLIVAAGSSLVGIGAYGADLHNFPVIAPWMDWLADRIYGALPILARLVPSAKMFVSAAAIGLVFFLAATVLVACLVPSSRIGALEAQMRGMQRQRQPRRVKMQ